MFAVREPGSVPVAYPSWTDWRVDKRESVDVGPFMLVPADTSFCATCWGQGRICSQARNGEGLIPHRCPACDGERVVRNP